jgi:hypothetical protein
MDQYQNQHYLYTTDANDTSIGQIERGLSLLGFKVDTMSVVGDDSLPSVRYEVCFSPGRITATGKRKTGEAAIELFEEVKNAEA